MASEFIELSDSPCEPSEQSDPIELISDDFEAFNLYYEGCKKQCLSDDELEEVRQFRSEENKTTIENGFKPTNTSSRTNSPLKKRSKTGSHNRIQIKQPKITQKKDAYRGLKVDIDESISPQMKKRLQELFSELGAEVNIAINPLDNSIVCSVATNYLNEDNTFKQLPYIIIIESAEKLSGYLDPDSLSGYCEHIKQRLSEEFHVFIIIEGLNKYLKQESLWIQRQFSNAFETQDSIKQQEYIQNLKSTIASSFVLPATEEDFENAFFSMQFEYDIKLLISRSSNATLDSIISYFGDFAFEYYKNKTKEGLIDVDTKAIGKIKSGSSKKEVYSLMLSQIHSITTDLADTIIERYPSFQNLLDSFASKGDCALSDLKVGTRFHQRPLGQALSKKICNILTSENPSLMA